MTNINFQDASFDADDGDDDGDGQVGESRTFMEVIEDQLKQRNRKSRIQKQREADKNKMLSEVSHANQGFFLDRSLQLVWLLAALPCAISNKRQHIAYQPLG